MKEIIISCIISISQIGYAQIIRPVKINPDSQSLRPISNNKSYQPRPVLYYLNSTKFSFDSTFIDPQNVKSIYVDKQSDTGKLFFVTKEQPWRYKTLNEVLSGNRPYSRLASGTNINQILYIDGRLKNLKSNIKIDYTFHPKVKIKKTTIIDAIGMTNKKTLIVNIWTTRKAQRRFQKSIKRPEQHIYLRGDTLGELISQYK
jgi:hypothetical protein